MSIKAIWAQTRDGVIGHGNTLPWDLPEDLAHFQRTTGGGTVVMGAATWASLPAAVRPLPGRRNLVLTRNPDLRVPGAEVVHSPTQVAHQHPDCWVIGGAQVYQAMLPHTVEIVRTLIDVDVPGDTFAPHLGEAWTPVAPIE